MWESNQGEDDKILVKCQSLLGINGKRIVNIAHDNNIFLLWYKMGLGQMIVIKMLKIIILLEVNWFLKVGSK